MPKSNKCDSNDCFGSNTRSPKINCEFCTKSWHTKCADLNANVVKLLRDTPGTCWLCPNCRNADNRKSASNETSNLILQRITSALKLIGGLSDTMQMFCRMYSTSMTRPSCCSAPRTELDPEVDMIDTFQANISNLFDSILGEGNKRARTSSLSRPSLHQPDKIARVDVPVSPTVTSIITNSTISDAFAPRLPSLFCTSYDVPPNNTEYDHSVVTTEAIAYDYDATTSLPAVASGHEAIADRLHASLPQQVILPPVTLLPPPVTQRITPSRVTSPLVPPPTAPTTQRASTIDAEVVSCQALPLALSLPQAMPPPLTLSLHSAMQPPPTVQPQWVMPPHLAMPSPQARQLLLAPQPPQSSLTQQAYAAITSSQSEFVAPNIPTIDCLHTAIPATHHLIAHCNAVTSATDTLTITTAENYRFAPATTNNVSQSHFFNTDTNTTYTQNGPIVSSINTGINSVNQPYSSNVATDSRCSTVNIHSADIPTLSVANLSQPNGNWFHISPFQPHESESNIVSYICKKFGCASKLIFCHKLVRNDNLRRRPQTFVSFKLLVPTEFEKYVNEPCFWPNGITIKPFLVKPRRQFQRGGMLETPRVFQYNTPSQSIAQNRIQRPFRPWNLPSPRFIPRNNPTTVLSTVV